MDSRLTTTTGTVSGQLGLGLDERAAQANTDRPGLREGRYLTLQERFEEWLKTDDGWFMYSWIADKAVDLRTAGWSHYGIGALWEAARFSRDVKVGPNAGFKLNNDFRSRMARRIMENHRTLQGFFETRELKA